ncbi:MAG: CHAT domain-containing tetratricopeptide repeat protein [Planctomycetota bacterium]
MGRFEPLSLPSRALVVLATLVLAARAGPPQGQEPSADSTAPALLAEAKEALDAGALEEATRYAARAATLLAAQPELGRADLALWLAAAQVAQRTGAYDLASMLLDDGLRRLEATFGAADPGRTAWLSAAASVRAWTGDYAGLVRLLEPELAALPENAERFDILNAYAIALDMLGRGAEARALLEREIPKADRLAPADSHDPAVLRDTLGVILSKLGHLKAASALRYELSALPDLPDYLAASNLENHAYLLMKLGSIEIARETFSQAIERLYAAYAPGHAEIGRLLGMLALFEIRMGDDAAARRWNDLQRESYEIARLSIQDPYLRASFFEASPDAVAALLAVRAGEREAAWLDADRSTGRATLELCAGAPDREDCARLSAALRRVHAKRFAAALAALAGRPASSADGQPPSHAAAKAELAALEREFDARFPWRHGAASVAAVQAELDDDQALVGWLVHHSRELPPTAQYGWVLRKTGDVHIVGLGSVGDVLAPLEAAGAALFAASRSSFGAGSDVRLGSVAERVLHPLLPHLDGVRELVVCPSDIFLRVPVELLPDAAGRPLLDRFDISYAPSASVYHFLQQRAAEGAPERALLIGDPPFRAEHLARMQREAQEPGLPPSGATRAAAAASLDALPRLPATRAEVLALAPLFDEPTVLLGADASEAHLDALRISGALERFGTLHIASHARIDPVDARASLVALARSPEMEGDGCVTVAEILDEWTLSADLVTLSACTTLGGARSRREGLFGFAQALFAAGARSVVASQWPVDDTATRLLMQRFYELVRADDGPSKVGALADAKRWLRDYRDETGEAPYRDPAIWAAFVLVGASD